MLNLWLAGWGILAFIAFAFPGVVVLGLFLLLPGLILTAAPTVFLYSAVFALVRHLLPHPPGVMRNLGAAAFALLAGWVAAEPWSIMGRRAFERANLPEFLPSSPVKLSGHIRLEMPEDSPRTKRDPNQCGALCAALLDTPGVESVTVAAVGQPADAVAPVFRLIPRGGDRSRGVFPVSPEMILDHRPPSVAAAWGLRLASREKLVVERTRIDPGMTIRITGNRRPTRNEISVSRVEILDRGGNALMRRSIVTGSALAAPLYFNGAGSLDSFRLQVARERLSSGPAHPPLNPVAELFRHSSLARPEADPGAITAMLDRLRRASADSSLSREDADLSLAALWFPTIDCTGPLPAYHVYVLAQVIPDERIPLPENLNAGCKAYVTPELRAALGARILRASTPRDTRAKLARILFEMPKGTFATLSADEKSILGSGELRSDAYSLIVRLADQGKAAVPELLAITRSDMTLTPAFRRIWVMRALSLAFAALGPEAQAVLPELDALVNAERSPLLHNAADRKRWYLALARMGKPLDEFQWFNRNRPNADARDREALRRRMEGFDPRRVWDY
ncbi:MAG: hypothetical protein SFV51_31355 [Bryobacteraceae bacterium]|nr:hypothetical protein [Bryobacteraceae bacterium]